jgi:hypothetical protein
MKLIIGGVLVVIITIIAVVGKETEKRSGAFFFSTINFLFQRNF